jgi:hypothetical protein
VKRQLITDVDASFGIFDGETFRYDRFATWLRERQYSWPLTATGRLALDADTFRAMVKIHPDLATQHELRHSLSQLRLEGLDIGSDGRNRTMLSPYRSKTGRNQPGNTRFIFGPATWIRSFIRPLPGWGLAYIDYDQQEWGIAATCSGDEMMMAAYEAGDAYIAFATQARAWPTGATKETHSDLRDRFKACGLGVQYGMGEASLSFRIGQSSAHAAELLRLHRRLYARYWAWSETVVNYALLRGELHTVFGWRLKVGTSVNPRSLANFPIQATGAEIMRLASIYLTEADIEVNAPVHDAFLIHSPLDRLDADIAKARELMSDASEVVLDGFRLRTDVKIVRYPERYLDKRGAEMWTRLVRLVRGVGEHVDPCAEARDPVHPCTPDPSLLLF